MYKLFLKRLLDIVMAVFLLLFFSPLLIVIILMLILFNRGQVLYFQERAGKNCKPFTLIKFKTMTDLCDKEGVLADDQQRLTNIGRVLRKTSLDELPQLLNIIVGDMSLIGPRPLFTKYLPYYVGNEKKRHSLKPGISGWAQVNGRNKLNWQQRLALDVYYIENISFRLDVLIIYKTIINILIAKDVVVDETYTIADLDEERKAMNEYPPDN